MNINQYIYIYIYIFTCICTQHTSIIYIYIYIYISYRNYTNLLLQVLRHEKLKFHGVKL